MRLGARPITAVYHTTICALLAWVVLVDLHSDWTPATTFLANAMRLEFVCASYALPHALRLHMLQYIALV
jgi:hypothetical protein